MTLAGRRLPRAPRAWYDVRASQRLYGVRAPVPSLDAQQVGDIVQSIVLHTSQWPSGTSSATKTLMTIFDVCGYDAKGRAPSISCSTADVLNREFDEARLLVLSFPWRLRWILHDCAGGPASPRG
ncbi:hypothetical protein FB451DRAFT_1392666 [Mycena latifolia]|nr:hypothetical protein FB451DRAFT_1392666 [Mycena latifolia]